MNNWLPLLLMLGALVLAAAEAVRSRNYGWAGVALFVLAIIVASGALTISDD